MTTRRLRTRRGGIAALLLPALLLAAAAVMGVLWWNEQQRANGLEVKLNALQQQLAQSESQLGQVRQQAQDAGKQNEKLKRDIDAKTQDFAKLKQQVEEADAARAQLEQENAQLADEKVSLIARVAGTARDRDDQLQLVKTLEQEKTKLESSVNRLRERLAWLDRDYRQIAGQLSTLQAERAVVNDAPQASASAAAEPPMAIADSSLPGEPLPDAAAASAVRPVSAASSQSVELPPIIVRKEQAAAAPRVRGRVVELNARQHFIVIDVGSQDGVQSGMVFNVLRGAAPVTRATVIRVRPRLSACDLPASTASQVRVGDVVVDTGFASSF